MAVGVCLKLYCVNLSNLLATKIVEIYAEICYLSINVSLNMRFCIFARIQSKHENFPEKNLSKHFMGSDAFRNNSFLLNQSKNSLYMLLKL